MPQKAPLLLLRLAVLRIESDRFDYLHFKIHISLRTLRIEPL